MLIPHLYILLSATLMSSHCSTLKRKPDHEYYHHPTHNLHTVAVVATNDLHGAAFPTLLRRTDNLQEYASGGLTVLGSMITTLRREFGEDNVLYLDAGDSFQGAIEAGPLISRGEIISDFFNEINLTAGAIGNHEFDFGPAFLQNYMRKRKAPFLAANVFDENGRPARESLPNVRPSTIV